MENDIFKNNDFDQLCLEVRTCVKCERMCNSQRVLNRSGGSLSAEILFVGEAPGRLGADDSGIPFHGDKAGHNFEELLEFAKIDRSKIFVTNAVLCNPKDEKGNNSTPTKVEIQNCSNFLKKQIEIINPKIVVTLGATSLESTRNIENHNLTLKENVRTTNKWFNRILIPLYHPGQRALMHRSFANQRSDYQFVSEQNRRINKISKTSKIYGMSGFDVTQIVREILRLCNTIDYFKLHKIFYLVEYAYFNKYKHRLTDAYIVRQKDGPYCTNLHYQKIKKSIPEAVIKEKNNVLYISYASDLFSTRHEIDECIGGVIEDTIKKYGNLTNSEIKTKVYLTMPMRVLLKIEQREKINLYNAPIIFELNN